MADEPVNPPIQTKYAEQLAADLEANQAEQATLTVRLNQLREEEKWLAGTLQSMPAQAAAEPTSPAADLPASGTVAATDGREEAAVPQPRAEKADSGAAPTGQGAAKKATTSRRAARKVPAKAAPVRKAAVKKTAPAKKAADPKKATPVTAAAKKTVKSQGPTLGELLKGLLAQQPGEPKKVSEIRTELEAAHPDRATSEQVVRNALTKLVAQDRLEKDNRQGVVLYTWPTTSAASASASEAKDAQRVEGALAGV